MVLIVLLFLFPKLLGVCICRDGAESFIVFISQTSRSMYLFKVRGKEQRDKNKEQTIHKTAELI